MIPKIGPLELVVILVVVLLLFGPKNLPKLGSAIGKTVKNLRDGLSSGKKEKKEAEDAEAAAEDVKAAEIPENAAEPKTAPAEVVDVPVEGKPAPKSSSNTQD